ncbi:MAG: ABC transporter permease, partial [Acidobacteria bacterium]|nr:ABC transporter permease [Acidobacteriota bacterium]
MTALMADVRSAIRALAAARGFTAVSVVTLGTALALCVTVLSIVNAYIIRALPYPAADRLFRVDYAAPNQNPPRGLESLDWSTLDDVIELAIAWDLDVFYLLGQRYPESIPGGWVTPGYVSGFGVRAAQGRSFTTDDFQPGSPAVALISDRVWRTRFLGDPAIVGRTFQAYVSDRPAEAETFTIVGVLPADLWHVNVYTDVLAPLRAPTYPYMVRLRQGVPPQTAADRISALVRQGATTVPPDFRAGVTSTQASYAASVRPLLWSVGSAAGLVLLIAGANVAVLMLVRGRGRQKELAMRLALGASNLRVARLLAAEAVMIGAVATILGIGLSQVAMSSLSTQIESLLERRVPGGVGAFEMDVPVWLAASACGFAVTLVLTLAPLAVAWRAQMATGLADTARGVTTSAGGRRSQSVLIAIEVAASFTLLAGAALMAESAIRMLRVDFGIESDRVVTASLALRDRSFPDDASRVALFDRLASQLAGFGGSASVAFGDWWPLQGSRPRRVDTSGATPTVGTANPFAVSPDYFSTLGMSLRDGRVFTPQDRIGGE